MSMTNFSLTQLREWRFPKWNEFCAIPVVLTTCSPFLCLRFSSWTRSSRPTPPAPTWMPTASPTTASSATPAWATCWIRPSRPWPRPPRTRWCRRPSCWTAAEAPTPPRTPTRRRTRGSKCSTFTGRHWSCNGRVFFYSFAIELRVYQVFAEVMMCSKTMINIVNGVVSRMNYM